MEAGGEYDEREESYTDEHGASYSKRNFISDQFMGLDEVFVRIDPDLPSNWMVLPAGAAEYIAEGGTIDKDSKYRLLDLYEGVDNEDFNWNRVDDLIIALYERLLRNSE